MNEKDLADFRAWFKKAYPNSKLVLHPNYVIEWKQYKQRQTT